MFKLSDTQNPSSLVTNDDLAWSLNGARAFSRSVWVFLVNENDEEEVEVGWDYLSLMVVKEVGFFFFFFDCVKEFVYVFGRSEGKV